MSRTELIGHKGDILWWEMSIRAVLIFIFGLVLIRLFGRRAFGKQHPLDMRSYGLAPLA
jgi:glucose dehydrogenase